MADDESFVKSYFRSCIAIGSKLSSCADISGHAPKCTFISLHFTGCIALASLIMQRRIQQFEKGGFHLMKTNMCKIHHLSINKDFLNVFRAFTTVFNKHLSHHYLFHIYFNSRVHCIIERFAVLV